MRLKQRAVGRRVGAVDAAGEHGDRSGPPRRARPGARRRRCRRRRRRRPSSPARPAGARTRRRRARRRPSTPGSRRSPPTGRPARPAGPGRAPTAPAAGRAPASASDWSFGSSGSSAVASVSACSGSAGHSSSSGTTSRAPHRSARRRSARLSSCSAGPPPARGCRSGAVPDRSRRTASTGPSRVDEAPEVDRARLTARLSQARARRTPGAAAGAAAAVVEVLVERHAATRCSRMPSASATSSAPGTVRPARSASVQADAQHPVEAAHRQRAALQRPLGEHQRRPRHRPSAPAADGRAPGCSPPARCRPDGRRRSPGPPGPARATVGGRLRRCPRRRARRPG